MAPTGNPEQLCREDQQVPCASQLDCQPATPLVGTDAGVEPPYLVCDPLSKECAEGDAAPPADIFQVCGPEDPSIPVSGDAQVSAQVIPAAACTSGMCVTLVQAQAGYCSMACRFDADCPSDSKCAALSTPDGADVRVCQR